VGLPPRYPLYVLEILLLILITLRTCPVWCHWLSLIKGRLINYQDRVCYIPIAESIVKVGTATLSQWTDENMLFNSMLRAMHNITMSIFYTTGSYFCWPLSPYKLCCKLKFKRNPHKQAKVMFIAQSSIVSLVILHISISLLFKTTISWVNMYFCSSDKFRKYCNKVAPKWWKNFDINMFNHFDTAQNHVRGIATLHSGQDFIPKQRHHSNFQRKTHSHTVICTALRYITLSSIVVSCGHSK